jgi:myosin heavy subunit
MALLEKELERLSTENSKIRDESCTYQMKLKDSDIRCQALLDENKSLSVQLEKGINQKDMDQLKEEHTKLQELHIQLESKYAEILDSMELVTLDKEMAEEKMESLENEVETLSLKIEEMSLDLEVLQGERDMMISLPENADKAEALKVFQTNSQNERLKDALLKLKLSRDEMQLEYDEKILSLEEKINSYDHIEKRYQDLESKFLNAETTIKDLQAALEDATGSEDLIDDLTFRNETLNDKVQEMQKYIEDLEAMKEINEELEENHVAAEKSLLQEIEVKDLALRNSEAKLTEHINMVADHERTIIQFRELVKSLQGEVLELRAAVPDSRTSHVTGSLEVSKADRFQEQNNLPLDFQIQNIKLYSKVMELDLKQIEVNVLGDHLNLMKNYLSDGSYDQDSLGIQVHLQVKRISQKSDLIEKYLNQLKSYHDSEEHLLMAYASRMCTAMKKLSDVFTSFVLVCKLDEFAKLGRIQREVADGERVLDSLIDALKADGSCNVLVLLQGLVRAMTCYEHSLISSTCAATFHAHPMVLSVFRRMESLYFDEVVASLLFSKRAIEAGPHESLEVTRLLTSLLDQAIANSRTLCVKLEGGASFGVRLVKAAEDRALLEAIRRCTQLTIGLPTFKSGDQHLSPGKVSANLQGLIEQLLEAVKQIQSDLTYLYANSATVDVEMSSPDTSSGALLAAPWIQRSSIMKQERDAATKSVQDNTEIRSHLKAAAKELKQKEESIRELMVKCQHLESRTANRNSQNGIEGNKQVQEMKRMTESQKQEISTLQQEIKSLKREMEESVRVNRSLQQPAKFLASSNGESDAEVSFEVSKLRSALRVARFEVARLKRLAALDFISTHRLLNGCSKLGIPFSRQWELENGTFPSSDFNAVVSQIRKLKVAVQENIAFPMLVDVSHAPSSHIKWCPQEKRPQIQLERSRMKYRLFDSKVQLALGEVQRLLQTQQHHNRISTISSSTKPTQSNGRNCPSNLGSELKLASIRVPSCQRSETEPIRVKCVIRSSKELDMIFRAMQLQ